VNRLPRGSERVFVVEVAALLRQPGSRRVIRIEGQFPGLEVPTSRVPDGASVIFDGVLESVSPGILVSGTVFTPWEGTCRRCLEPAVGVVEDEVCELCCEDGDVETTYPLHGDLLDLAPLVRDACILDLPLAPLCRADCAGLCPECGVNRNLEQCSCDAPIDSRWAALRALSDEVEGSPATGTNQSE
jgi:uncharacterized protein